jgi:hypothetical protein
MEMKTQMEMKQELVDRFLAWPLPQSVCSDLCATNPSYQYPRSGTNLLNADEAIKMIEYLLEEYRTLSVEDTKKILGADAAYQMPVPPVSVAHARSMIDSGAAKRIDHEESLISALEGMLAKYGDYSLPTPECVIQARAALSAAKAI